jgi:CRISPR-associated protein Cmr6
VKGVLREYFKEFYEGDLDVDDLVQDIFSGKVRNTEKDKYDDKGKLLVKGYDNKSIYNRDIFFDAVIKSPFRNDKNQDIFLVDDSITPHTEGPLKNPTPIKMLKIAPGCKMEFRFKLNNHKIKDREYTSDFILEIFKKILGTVGVGAKTNVGYGQLKIEK